jgi:propanediol dehydratase small subunit
VSHAYSGRSIDGLDVQAVAAGELSLDDIRIHPDTLERQARTAEQLGNPQLAENFRRAAELTRLPDQDLLRVYEALGPGRSTPAQLLEIADAVQRDG